MPPEVNGYYEDTWKKIVGGGYNLEIDRANLILSWLTVSQQTLALATLRDALSLSDENLKANPLKKSDIIDLCGGFLRVEGVLDIEAITVALPHHKREQPGGFPEKLVITFIHPSAQHFLLARQQEYFPEAYDVVVKACLRSLTPSKTMYALLPAEPETLSSLSKYVSCIMFGVCTNQCHSNPAMASVSPMFVTLPLYGPLMFGPDTASIWPNVILTHVVVCAWVVNYISMHPRTSLADRLRADATMSSYAYFHLRTHLQQMGSGSSALRNSAIMSVIQQSSQLHVALLLLCTFPLLHWTHIYAGGTGLTAPQAFPICSVIHQVWFRGGIRYESSEVKSFWLQTISRALTLSYLLGFHLILVRRVE